jgi:hypothetical protein
MKIKKNLTILALAVSSSLAIQSASGATILSTAAARIDDYQGAGTGSLDPDGQGDANRGNANMLVGFFGDNAVVEDMSSIWVFQMTGTALGTDITNANFSVTQTGGATPFVVDAHVIRTSSVATFLVSDYQTSALNIMDDFGAGGNVEQSLDTAGQLSLASYLQTNWVENEYIFIGIKNDPLLTGNSAQNGDGNSFRSYTKFDNGGTLTVTAVPEPTSAALLGLGGFALILRRRK